MSSFLIRVTQVFALATIGTAVLADASFAEKNTTPLSLVKQMCATARGQFHVEKDGRFSCIYPNTAVNGSYYDIKYCTADGDCEMVSYCDHRECSRRSYFPKDDKKKPGGNPKPKPTKLEGPTTVTAGTADQRGAGVSGDTTAGALNPNFGLGGSSSPTSSPLASSTGAASSASATANKPAIRMAKPSAIPGQLAERLRRLQQQQR